MAMIKRGHSGIPSKKGNTSNDKKAVWVKCLKCGADCQLHQLTNNLCNECLNKNESEKK